MATRPSFYADDAFAYVETYNDLRSKNIQQINQLKEELSNKFWDGNVSDHLYYVKLRAHEHALKYKDDGRAPEGMVIIGDTAGGPDVGISEEEQKIKKVEAEAKKFSEAVKNMQSEIKKGQAREVSLKGEIIQREQVIKRVQRQMNNTQGTYAVLISVLILAAALAFWL